MRIGSAIIAAIVVTLGGCERMTAAPPLGVTIAVDRAEASAAAPVGITVRLLNYGSEALTTLNPKSYGCFEWYRVYDNSGTEVPLPVRYCNLMGYLDVQLAPGDSIVLRDQWAGDVRDGQFGAKPVPAGEYHIMAQVFAVDREFTTTSVAVQVR